VTLFVPVGGAKVTVGLFRRGRVSRGGDDTDGPNSLSVSFNGQHGKGSITQRGVMSAG